MTTLSFSFLSDRTSYYLNDELKKFGTLHNNFLRKLQILLQEFNLIFNVLNFFLI
jgi:hypothetical protein